MTSGVCVKGMATVEGKIWASSNWHLFLKKNLPGHPRSWHAVLWLEEREKIPTCLGAIYLFILHAYLCFWAVGSWNI